MQGGSTACAVKKRRIRRRSQTDVGLKKKLDPGKKRK